MGKVNEYLPNCSSYVPRGDRTSRINFGALDNSGIASKGTLNDYWQDSFIKEFEVQINNKSAGEIFNLYEELTLNSKWDVRENGDYQTVILGREYMFYSVDNSPISNNIYFYNQSNDYFTNNNVYAPIEFLKVVDDKLLKDKEWSLYDLGTIIQSSENISVQDVNAKSNLDKMACRKQCRKISENWFAISGFNLITHDISINSDVINTMSEVIDEDGEKNTISILGEVADEYIVEKTIVPPIINSSATEKENVHRSDEFLANKLLEELKYVYQGSIIINYNPDIEIGDTITLIDNINSIFGVFEIDSFEHSLDNRGLITSLIVRASFTLRDPFLDYHAQDIGYKLINQLKTKLNMNEYTYDTNSQFVKITALYLKTLVQFPKYCVFYKKKEKGFFNKATVMCNNVVSPAGVPLRFYPMYKKGKAQIPKNIEYAFAAGSNTNNINGIIESIFASIEAFFSNTLKGFARGSLKLLTFLSDMLISTVTFNLHELIKPLLGMTTAKAVKQTYDEVNKIAEEEALSVLNYNPYSDKYKLIYNNLDIKLCFFNVRCQSVKDLFAGNLNLEITSENAVSLLNRKVNIIRKMLTDIFDCMFMVELYDGFNVTEKESSNNGLIRRYYDGEAYIFQDFLKDCLPDNFKLYCTEQIATNYIGNNLTSNEYGAVLKKDDFNISNYKKVNLYESDRKAIEVTLDTTGKLGPINTLKIIFFHNLYGESKLDKNNNSIQTRRENVTKLIDTYIPQISADTGIIIAADFNLVVYNPDSLPFKCSATEKNATYRLPSLIKTDNGNQIGFVAQIKDTATTLNQYGYLDGNLYDNVLISSNLKDLVTAQVFEFPENDKLTVSDHIPVVIGIKTKTQV